jgi:GMP synthase-like glutamine amidotransferase/4-hydroxybenzoate polyprenyltransferase
MAETQTDEWNDSVEVSPPGKDEGEEEGQQDEGQHDGVMTKVTTALLMCEDHPKWGHYRARCESLFGRPVDLYSCFDGEFPNLDRYDSFVISGSHYSILDEADHEWMGDLCDFIHSLGKRTDKRSVAICFGCQAVAHALGGEVERSDTFRFGGESLTMFEESEVYDLPEEVKLITSHGDRVVDLPDSIVLAESEGTPYEIFVTGCHYNILGVQCHPELTKEDAMRCIAPALVESKRIPNDLPRIEEEMEGAEGDCVKMALRKFLDRDTTLDMVQKEVEREEADAKTSRATRLTLISYTCYVAHVIFFMSALHGGLLVDLLGLGSAMSATALVYMADRMIVQEEDVDADHPHLRHARSSTSTMFLFLFSMIWAVCAWFRPANMLYTVLFSLVCVWYAVPIPYVGRRIKNLFPLSKNVFVGLVHTLWALACHRVRPEKTGDYLTLAFATFSVTMSTMFMDVKDVEGDRRAGVFTLPTALGPWSALRAMAFLYSLASVLAIAAIHVSESASWFFLALSITYTFHMCAMLGMAEAEFVPNLEFVCISWSLPLLLFLPIVAIAAPSFL